MKLENWAVVHKDPDPYKPPENKAKYLQGFVYGHPTFKEGEPITTSAILHTMQPNFVVTLSGSKYELGTPAKDYEEAFPNALRKVIDTGVMR